MTDRAGPLLVTAQLARADQSWAERLRRAHYPPERNQVPAHVSLFRHLPPSLEEELRGLLRALVACPRPAARIEELRSLGTGVAIAIASPELQAIRAAIAERFDRHLIPQDRAAPRLHITIQNKVTPAVAAATLAALSPMEPRATHVAALVCWRYRDGPWEMVSRHAFRG